MQNKVLDLFAGIGGFSLGLEAAGYETVAFAECDPYAKKVLRKNWPEVPIYDDVREITAERLVSDGLRVDIITGGFPCQDISVAGNQAGIADGTRSGLWSECARLLGDIRPRFAIFENVTALLHGERGDWFKRVLWDISSVGYDAEWHCIPASELGAHHHRDRIWIICYPRDVFLADPSALHGGDTLSFAEGGKRQTQRTQNTNAVAGSSKDLAYPNDNGSSSTEESSGVTSRGDNSEAGQEQASESEGLCATRINENVADPILKRSQRWLHRGENAQRQGESRHSGCHRTIHRQPIEDRWAIEPDVGRVANGVPARSHRLKCLGNAIVPQIAQFIGESLWDSSG